MNTTISISKETKQHIIEFGDKGETYNEILERILASAKERQIQEILMDTSNSITIKEARARLNK